MKNLWEVDIVDKLDLVRKRSWFKKAMRELGVERKSDNCLKTS